MLFLLFRCSMVMSICVGENLCVLPQSDLRSASSLQEGASFASLSEGGGFFAFGKKDGGSKSVTNF